MLGRRLLGVLEGALAAGAEHRQAAVARDRVEPGAQMDVLVRGRELAIRGHERVLDGVLGLLGGAEHVAAEGEDAAVMAVIDGLERGLGAATEQLDEPVVGGEAQQPAGIRGPERMGRRAAEASIVLALSTDRCEGRSDLPPSWPETRWERAGWMVSLYPIDMNAPARGLKFAR